MKLQGAITALVTPFTRNGGVNYDKLAELIEFQIENGAAGIVLLGTTGEAPTIRPDEAEHIIRTGVETAANAVGTAVGTVGKAVGDGLDQAAEAVGDFFGGTAKLFGFA